MKTSSWIILGVIIIAVVIVGVFSISNITTTQAPSVSAAETKLNLKNNCNQCWTIMDIVIENATKKDGSKQTIYIQAFIKPGENVTIDLSQILGYSNEKLPPGTSFRILTWSGKYHENPTGTSDLNILEQGWSNTDQPTTEDPSTKLFYTPVPNRKLPSGITESKFVVSTNLAELEPLNPDTEPIFVEQLLTVDQNGRVNIRLLGVPELCQLIAHIF